MGGADVVWTAHGHGNDVRAAIVFVLFTAQRAVFRSFTAVSSDRSLAGIVQPYCPQKKSLNLVRVKIHERREALWLWGYALSPLQLTLFHIRGSPVTQREYLEF